MKIDDSVSELGEGLALAEDKIFWVDILNHCLYYKENHQTPSKNIPTSKYPSVIFDINGNYLLYGHSTGVSELDIQTFESREIYTVKQLLDPEMRMNDGVKLSDGRLLFGTMNLEPVADSGRIFLYDGEVIDTKVQIGIPNTFIQINSTTVLISDSLTANIYSFDLMTFKMSLWKDLSAESYVPDGGCISNNNHIFIAMWDGSMIQEYSIDGQLLNEYQLPVSRPTNCKYHSSSESIVITSANDNASNDSLVRPGNLLKLKVLNETC